MVIAFNVLAAFVIFCGLKLFDMGSSLADPIRRYGRALGIVLLVVAIFNFVLKDTLVLIGGGDVLWIALSGMIGFALLGFIDAVAKRRLLRPKQTKSRKQGRPSGLSVAAVATFDIIFGCIIGAVAGISFTLNFGTGAIVLCALILLQIVGKVATIRSYQDAFLSRREIIAIVVASVTASPVVASLVNIWARGHYRHVGVFMALAIAYLAYLGLYHLIIIVKKFQNR